MADNKDDELASIGRIVDEALSNTPPIGASARPYSPTQPIVEIVAAPPAGPPPPPPADNADIHQWRAWFTAATALVEYKAAYIDFGLAGKVHPSITDVEQDEELLRIKSFAAYLATGSDIAPIRTTALRTPPTHTDPLGSPSFKGGVTRALGKLGRK